MSVLQTPLVELDRVSVHRAEKDILRNATFRIDDGRHWAVLGPNGGGKSTLLRLAAGYVRPNRGVVRWDGEELVDLRVLRRRIAWISSDLAADVPAHETAFKTVVSGRLGMIGLRRLGGVAPQAEDFEAARAMLQTTRCEALGDKPFGVLSQGERQQVLVARARMVDPRLIILDEPCAGMDPGARERFLAWLHAEAAKPTSPTIVFVTHHVEEIMPSFESTLLVRGGEIVAAGPTAEVLTSGAISALYGVGVERLELVNRRRWPIWGA